MSRLRILTPDGVEDVEVTRFRTASLIGSYWNDVQRFLATGDERGLDQYRDVRIRGFRLATEADDIELSAAIGEIDIDDIYETE